MKKRRTLSRFLSFLMAFAMVVTLPPTAAFAEETSIIDESGLIEELNAVDVNKTFTVDASDLLSGKGLTLDNLDLDLTIDGEEPTDITTDDDRKDGILKFQYVVYGNAGDLGNYRTDLPIAGTVKLTGNKELDGNSVTVKAADAYELSVEGYLGDTDQGDLGTEFSTVNGSCDEIKITAAQNTVDWGDHSSDTSGVTADLSAVNYGEDVYVSAYAEGETVAAVSFYCKYEGESIWKKGSATKTTGGEWLISGEYFTADAEVEFNVKTESQTAVNVTSTNFITAEIDDKKELTDVTSFTITFSDGTYTYALDDICAEYDETSGQTTLNFEKADHALSGNNITATIEPDDTHRISVTLDGKELVDSLNGGSFDIDLSGDTKTYTIATYLRAANTYAISLTLSADEETGLDVDTDELVYVAAPDRQEGEDKFYKNWVSTDYNLSNYELPVDEYDGTIKGVVALNPVTMCAYEVDEAYWDPRDNIRAWDKTVTVTIGSKTYGVTSDVLTFEYNSSDMSFECTVDFAEALEEDPSLSGSIKAILNVNFSTPPIGMNSVAFDDISHAGVSETKVYAAAADDSTELEDLKNLTQGDKSLSVSADAKEISFKIYEKLASDGLVYNPTIDNREYSFTSSKKLGTDTDGNKWYEFSFTLDWTDLKPFYDLNEEIYIGIATYAVAGQATLTINYDKDLIANTASDTMVVNDTGTWTNIDEDTREYTLNAGQTYGLKFNYTYSGTDGGYDNGVKVTKFTVDGEDRMDIVRSAYNYDEDGNITGTSPITLDDLELGLYDDVVVEIDAEKICHTSITVDGQVPEMNTDGVYPVIGAKTVRIYRWFGTSAENLGADDVKVSSGGKSVSVNEATDNAGNHCVELDLNTSECSGVVIIDVDEDRYILEIVPTGVVINGGNDINLLNGQTRTLTIETTPANAYLGNVELVLAKGSEPLSAASYLNEANIEVSNSITITGKTGKTTVEADGVYLIAYYNESDTTPTTLDDEKVLGKVIFTQHDLLSAAVSGSMTVTRADTDGTTFTLIVPESMSDADLAYAMERSDALKWEVTAEVDGTSILPEDWADITVTGRKMTVSTAWKEKQTVNSTVTYTAKLKTLSASSAAATATETIELPAETVAEVSDNASQAEQVYGNKNIATASITNSKAESDTVNLSTVFVKGKVKTVSVAEGATAGSITVAAGTTITLPGIDPKNCKGQVYTVSQTDGTVVSGSKLKFTDVTTKKGIKINKNILTTKVVKGVSAYTIVLSYSVGGTDYSYTINVQSIGVDQSKRYKNQTLSALDTTKSVAVDLGDDVTLNCGIWMVKTYVESTGKVQAVVLKPGQEVKVGTKKGYYATAVLAKDGKSVTVSPTGAMDAKGKYLKGNVAITTNVLNAKAVKTTIKVLDK